MHPMVIPLRRSLPVLVICGLPLLAGSCGEAGGPAAPGTPGRPGDHFALSATSLAFGPSDVEHPLSLVNDGSAAVQWRSETSAAWLSVSPAGGTLPAGETAVRVRVDRSILGVGSHAGQARFYLDDLLFAVAVTAEKPDVPLARIEPTDVSLGVDDPSVTVTISNVGGAPLAWSMAGSSWIAIAPAAGSLEAAGSIDVVLEPARSKLSDGVHKGTVTLTSTGGPATVALTVKVASPADLRTAPSSIDFGDAGTSRNLLISNAGGRELTWSATSDAAWLTPVAASGSVPPHTTRSIAFTASRGGLAPGEHTTTLRLDSNGGTRSIAVRIEVPDAPPPPPPPPPGGSVALEGRVVDQFTGSAVAGLSVDFAGATAVTDANGRFTISGSPSDALQQLELSGGAIHRRRTYARSSHTSWETIPSSFDMSAFDDLAREYEPRTIRWMADPAVYIDPTAYNFPGGESTVPQAWIDEIESAVGAWMAEWSDGEIGPGSITVGVSPPPEGTPGTVVILFDEDPARYTSAQTVGMARTYWTSSRSISSARIWLRFDGIDDSGARRAIFGHELGHAFGMGHMNGGTPSLMTPFVSTSGLTTFDRRAGAIVYGRSPGNSSPDTDDPATFVGLLAPAAPGLPAGSYDWVCGEPGADRR